jgi:hypothetical protein
MFLEFNALEFVIPAFAGMTNIKGFGTRVKTFSGQQYAFAGMAAERLRRDAR